MKGPGSASYRPPPVADVLKVLRVDDHSVFGACVFVEALDQGYHRGFELSHIRLARRVPTL